MTVPRATKFIFKHTRHTGNANRRDNVIHKSIAESMNLEKLTLREEEMKKEGEKNTLLLRVRRLKSPQVRGRSKIILAKHVVKRLRNVTHFTLIKNIIIKC